MCGAGQPLSVVDTKCLPLDWLLYAAPADLVLQRALGEFAAAARAGTPPIATPFLNSNYPPLSTIIHRP